MAVTSPAVVALEGSLYVTGGAILEDGDGIELVQRSVRSRIAGFRRFWDCGSSSGIRGTRASDPNAAGQDGPSYKYKIRKMSCFEEYFWELRLLELLFRVHTKTWFWIRIEFVFKKKWIWISGFKIRTWILQSLDLESSTYWNWIQTAAKKLKKL